MVFTIPEELGKPIADLADYANFVLRRGDFEDAITIHKSRYDILRAVENLSKQRMHKADPLQMWGLCLLYAGKSNEAFVYYAAAHVENTVSDGPIRTKNYAAYYVLTHGYGVPEQKMEAFSQYIMKNPSESDPFCVVRAYETSLNTKIETLAIRGISGITWSQLSIEQIGSTCEKRVFLGGSFGNILWLKRIESAIIEIGYYPVVAINFKKPSDMNTDDFTKTLISKCKFAVFEISELGRGGFIHELPRARDSGAKCTGIYQSVDLTERKFSGELDWLPTQPYSSLDDLKKRLTQFLAA